LGQLSTKYFRHTVNSQKLQKYHTVPKQQLQLEYPTDPLVAIQNKSTLTILDDVDSSSTSNNFLSDETLSSSPYQMINHDIPKFTASNDSFDHLSLKTKPHITIKDKLRSWILHFKVPHNCVNNLLNILNSEGLNLPNDVRTLMNTPQIHEISNIGNGNYTHLGLKNMLQPLLTHFKCHISTTLKLGINMIDFLFLEAQKVNFGQF